MADTVTPINQPKGNGSPTSSFLRQKSCKKRSNSPYLPEIKSPVKMFMQDPSVFILADLDEPNRGPGSYELPPIIGKKSSKALNGGSPKSSRSPVSTSSKGSPGVWQYDPKREVILTNSPRCAKQKEDRFRWLGATQDEHVPLMYEADINTKLKRHGGKFLKGSRFIEAKPSPGPGDYEISRSPSGINILRQDTKKVLTKRSSVDFIGLRSPRSGLNPGPGDYETYTSTMLKNGPNFPKSKRFPDPPKGPAPGEYDIIKLNALAGRNGQSFGKSHKGINYKSVDAVNKWSSKFDSA